MNIATARRFETSNYRRQCCLCGGSIEVGDGPVLWDSNTRQTAHENCRAVTVAPKLFAGFFPPETVLSNDEGLNSAKLARVVEEVRTLGTSYSRATNPEPLEAAQTHFVRLLAERERQGLVAKPLKDSYRPTGSDLLRVGLRNGRTSVILTLKATSELEPTAPVVANDGEQEFVLYPVETGPTTLLDGLYSVAFESGEPRALKLETQPEDADFMPGVQLVWVWTSSKEFRTCGAIRAGEFRVWKQHLGTAFGNALRAAVARLLADPARAGQNYAEKSGKCCRCNRKLTVPASLHKGMGPTCAKLAAEKLQRGRK